MSELVSRVKVVLEFNPSLKNICVSGEVSNLRVSSFSFFSLKDEFSKINCVCFDNSIVIEDNSLIKVYGQLSFNKKSGGVSFVVKRVDKVSKSLIYERFLKTKERLEKKGYFESKKSLPLFPERIGVVTSKESDAFSDVLNVLNRRFSCAQVYLKHSSVQGFGSVRSLCDALSFLDGKVDVILIVRGGGSYEDLDVFNSEELARFIFNLRTPIVSGVGHETDFTICDFVCDKRASTPSVAAEICTPNKFELNREVDFFVSRSFNFLKSYLVSKTNYVDSLLRISNEKIKGFFNGKKNFLDVLCEGLKVYDKEFVLDKGYSLVIKDDKILTDADVGDEVFIFSKNKSFRSVIF